MKSLLFNFIVLTSIALTFSSCGEPKTEYTQEVDELNEAYKANEREIEYEKYIAEIDANDSLTMGSSLYYSREGGESIEVKVFINDKDETVKLIERYTTKKSQSINSKHFYLKEGKKFATRELFEGGSGNDLCFNERVTYYDKKEKPIVTKFKTATFEEELVLESFKISDPQDCSIKRTLEVLNQEGKFATTFQGFIKESPFSYMIVGENDPNGYTSSLVVQFVDKTIQTLQANEKDMIGKGLLIDFQTLDSGEGYEYQILLRATLL